ncbi:hypothetical protein B0T20DRAFT_274249 [Sordaria brevicollis]|uniref:Uncharacterized protein n=1 Tax=Sordaria brevicollis TaxID=83679 RepID=A0AAE0PAS6_SORBR|nr:hypothetical protein B0T20DRAFT_274249 [Sordaria brevicollis]
MCLDIARNGFVKRATTQRPFARMFGLAVSKFADILDWFRFLDPSTPVAPEHASGHSYRSCATQTSDDFQATPAVLEFFTSRLEHLTEFFDAGLQSVMSPFAGNTQQSSTSSPVAVHAPQTPVRQRSSTVSTQHQQTKSASPFSIFDSDGEAA